MPATSPLHCVERETALQFVPTLYPDYHPDAPGGAAIGRSILAKPYDIRGLGKDMARLKPPEIKPARYRPPKALMKFLQSL